MGLLRVWAGGLALGIVLGFSSSRADSRGFLQARVFSIGDGDTITVLAEGGKLKVRLACIDAPEMAQGAAGASARRALQSLLPVGSDVYLKLQGDDRYGRQVAEVFRDGDSVPVNLALVANGDAFVYRQYWDSCDKISYAGSESSARVSERGVWGSSLGDGLLPPWQFRSLSRKTQQKSAGIK